MARRWWSRNCGSVIAGTIAVAGAQGCAIFTNLDVDGYSVADAGRGDANGCDAQICPSLSLDCRSAAECDEGGACCLTVTAAASVAFACEATCKAPQIQLCASHAECASCTTYQCPINGVVIHHVGACGQPLGCTPE